MPDLTLLTVPDEFNLVGEGIPVKISCTDPFTEGIPPVFDLVFNEASSSFSGKSFTLSFNGMSLTFTFVDQADNSGLQLTDILQYSSLSNFINGCLDELHANYYIDQDFILSMVNSKYLYSFFKL